MKRDILSRFFDWFLTTMGNLNPVTQSFLIRIALILGLACLLPALAFIRGGNRSQLLQRLLFIIGVFIGGVMSINWLMALQPKFKSYLLTLCLLAIVFLPLVIPFFIARTAGGEITLRWLIAAMIAVLFLINLVSSRFA